MRIAKITIIKTRIPDEGTINEKIQWVAGSLGLFTKRDKDKSCFRVFVELLRQAKLEEGISSDELAERLKLTRGTVVYHLNTLQNTGLLESSHNKYYLSKKSLTQVVDDIDNELREVLQSIKAISESVDKSLHLKS